MYANPIHFPVLPCRPSKPVISEAWTQAPLWPQAVAQATKISMALVATWPLDIIMPS